jgi:hypothetical protein
MPLRRATALPTTPEPKALEAIEQVCCAALVWANRSCGALKAVNHRRELVSAERRREQLERNADLADEARTKLRFHVLNAKLAGVIREREEKGAATVGLIAERERQRGFWLVEMVRPPLQSFTKRALMAPLRQVLGEG